MLNLTILNMVMLVGFLLYDITLLIFARALMWHLAATIFTILSLGLLYSWVRISFQRPWSRAHVILFSGLNILQALFFLFVPIMWPFPGPHTYERYLRWLVTDGYVHTSMSLVIILVLVTNIIYLMQPKIKDKFKGIR